MAFRTPPRLAYLVPDEVGEEAVEPTVFLMPLPDGPPVVLRGSAAMIWVLAADGEDDVAAAVASAVGLDRSAVVGDVESFLADLVDRGLLRRETDHG